MSSHKRTKKDPNAPRGAISAYLFFCRDALPILKKERPSITFAESGKALGERWRALSPEEKQRYVELAERDKIRCLEEMEEYKKHLSTQ